MSTKSICIITASVCAAMMVGIIVGSITNEEPSFFTANNEALSYSECLNSVTNNTGHCSIKVDGTGVACVEPAWYQIKDCYGEI